MLPFRRILFPVDYSAACCAIVPYVRDMTRHFSADLTLVHAYTLIPSFATRDSETILVYSELTGAPLAPEATKALVEGRLQEFAAQHFPGQHVECFSREGEPGTVIESFVERNSADLVMMPTHGYGPMRRFLLGSVTAKVLHDISAAVWTGAGAALHDHSPGIPYRSIVCALDRTEEAEAVLQAAATLATSYQARLFLLNVVEGPPSTAEYDMTAYTQELVDAAAHHVRELKGRLAIDAPHTVVEGYPAEAIREEAVRRKADLVVTGRGHAQGRLSALWSRLYPIVRESPCPVISI